VSAKAAAAGSFINGNLPTADDGAGALINAAFGLTAVDSCAYAPTIRSLVANLKSQASDFTADNPGRAALLAILASAMGEDPTSFGGVDLLAIVGAGTQADGQVGSYASAFVQSYAVIAYVRAGKPVPGLVLSNLVNSQDQITGAFGYDFGGFTPDYDTTGLVIQALHAAGGSSAAIAAAVAWATSQQNVLGYWPNPYSPVDSTGILGSGMQLVGTGTGGALGWIESQQLADGGFPAQLGDATSNVMATMDALWLITGTSYVTVTFQATGCTSTLVPSPAATAATLSSLADTGAPDGSIQVTLFGGLVLVTGLALVASRRKVRQP
jgi:LPXTG-motif cell wall-anchored protein